MKPASPPTVPNPPPTRGAALRIALAYVAVSSLWIFGSDGLLYRLVGDRAQTQLFATVKGICFVLVTGGLLLMALDRYFRAMRGWTASVRESEARSRFQAQILDQITDMVTATDLEGRITYVNRAQAQALGRSPEWLLGKPVEVLGHDPGRGVPHREVVAATLAHGQWRGEVINCDAKGRPFLIDLRTVVIRDADGCEIGLCGVGTDVTERKQLEAELRHAQKLEAVGQLAGGVAHDFNNILAAMMMHLGLISLRKGLDAEVREVLGDLEAGAQRAAGLTRQLLMFSRRSTLDMRPVDLAQVAGNLLRMLQRLLGERHRLSLEVEPLLPWVRADAGTLEQVMMNLTVNSRDAMPKGGGIQLRLRTREIGMAEVTGNPRRRAGRFVELSVTDEGEGMDEETLRRIFEPFFTTKPPGQGTGLGLATVHGIVAQHEGWVEVESAPGRGAVFRVLLPALPGVGVSGAGTAAEVVLPRGSETLLLVEDEASVRANTARWLRGLGYRVEEASNGPEALKRWAEVGGGVKLVITDWVMPDGLSGAELVRELRARRPGVKIIVLSGYAPEHDGVGPCDPEGVVRASKPIQPDRLAALVRETLDARGVPHWS